MQFCLHMRITYVNTNDPTYKLKVKQFNWLKTSKIYDLSKLYNSIKDIQ